jgi:hypothetical protein
VQHAIDVVEHLDLARPCFAGRRAKVFVRPGLVGGIDPSGFANGDVELGVEVRQPISLELTLSWVII